MASGKECVQIKTVNNEIQIHIAEDAKFRDVRNQLRMKIEKDISKQSSPLKMKILGKNLSKRQERDVKNILVKSGVVIAEEDDNRKENKSEVETSGSNSTVDDSGDQVELRIDPMTHFEFEFPVARMICRTIRSGTRIVSPDTLVILGDVNPGAEVMSDQDIYVWGVLRGHAHAGRSGNKKAKIVATSIETMQLEIAGCVAKRPFNRSKRPKDARYEYAYVHEKDDGNKRIEFGYGK